MKYGETLRQRSIPAWSHRTSANLPYTARDGPGGFNGECAGAYHTDTSSADNIDYDDIKQFIKEGTTSGRGKTVSIPGRDDDKRLEFENSLFAIFADQHHRIDLFVRSKAGEIRRRIGELMALIQRPAMVEC